MPADSDRASIAGTLPIVLAAAVVQGWALYGLHWTIRGQHWPATQPAVLLVLYALAIFVPLTTQLLAEHARRKLTWSIIAALGLLFAYFGWHHGRHVLDSDTSRADYVGNWLDGGPALVLVPGILWLLVLPFIQARLIDGSWRVRYEALFATAWRNKLTLAEAVLFTGLFWLLLMLWQALFKMLGINFFSQLFEEPIFVYPVTALAFGVALHLIGSVERLTSVLLEHLLNVLKWLALLAGLILTLFTLALIFKLPNLFESGERVIGAAWLLWLVAVTVLLVNAAYRDGSIERPYPRAVALALRFVIPLTIVSALTGVYALYLRIDTYGFSVERVWASIVAAAACVYSVGYAFAALGKGRWMAGVARINIGAALFLIAVVALALTPILSPYRMAANSQFALAQEANLDELGNKHGSPLHYLRFYSGEYGEARLRQLASLQDADHPHAGELRAAATAMLGQKEAWEPVVPADMAKRLARMEMYPRDRSLDPALRDALETHFKSRPHTWDSASELAPLAGIFADLNADGNDEFILICGTCAYAFVTKPDGWRLLGKLAPHNGSVLHGAQVIRNLDAGNVRVQPSEWQELWLDSVRLQLQVTPQPNP